MFWRVNTVSRTLLKIQLLARLSICPGQIIREIFVFGCRNFKAIKKHCCYILMYYAKKKGLSAHLLMRARLAKFFSFSLNRFTLHPCDKSLCVPDNYLFLPGQHNYTRDLRFVMQSIHLEGAIFLLHFLFDISLFDLNFNYSTKRIENSSRPLVKYGISSNQNNN